MGKLLFLKFYLKRKFLTIFLHMELNLFSLVANEKVAAVVSKTPIKCQMKYLSYPASIIDNEGFVVSELNLRLTN